jgi:hypothetical protein
MWSMTLKNSKTEGFLCKSRENFIIIVAQRDGNLCGRGQTHPQKGKKKKPVKGLGGGGKLCHFLHHII